MNDRSRLRSSKRVTVRDLEFEVFRMTLNEQIAAAEAAKPYEGTEAHRFVLIRETIARMVHYEGEPLGADAGTMDIDLVFALAPHVTDVNVGPIVPEMPPVLAETPDHAGPNGAEPPGPKGAS